MRDAVASQRSAHARTWSGSRCAQAPMVGVGHRDPLELGIGEAACAQRAFAQRRRSRRSATSNAAHACSCGSFSRRNSVCRSFWKRRPSGVGRITVGSRSMRPLRLGGGERVAHEQQRIAGALGEERGRHAGGQPQRVQHEFESDVGAAHRRHSPSTARPQRRARDTASAASSAPAARRDRGTTASNARRRRCRGSRRTASN